MTKIKFNSYGFASIIILLILTGLVLIVTFSVNAIIFTKKKISQNLVSSTQSHYSAESGIEDGLLRVTKGYNYTAVNNFTLDGADIDQNITQNGDEISIESVSLYSSNERKVRTKLS